MFQYIAQLVNKLHKCYSAELSPALTAEALEEIGSEDNFNWLLDQEPATVTGTVDSLHKRFVGGPAPEKFLAFTAATFQALQDKYPADEPAPGAPPDTAPAAPAPAPAAQPDSGANGQGVQP